MAESGVFQSLTFKSAEDLSAKRYHIVVASGSAFGEINPTIGQALAATNTNIVGVLVTDPSSAQFGTVVYDGKCKVTAGGAITVGVTITTNGSGRAAAAASGDMVIGRALEAGVTDGDVITAKIGPIYRHMGPV